MKNIFVYIYIIGSLVACAPDQKKDVHRHTETETTDAKYACPMHPEIVRDTPGKCPICDMDLVAVDHTESKDIMLSSNQMKLANITTGKVAVKPLGQTVVINGKLVVDEDRTEVISSRAAGRVERLFVKETGGVVKQGEPLYQLYSETLLVLQREFLLANDQYESLGKDQSRYATFLKAAEQKLLLYGLSSKQVERLKQTKSLDNTVTFHSPVSGVIAEINSAEGQYISEGMPVYRIEDLDHLWVEAELYPNETSLLQAGSDVRVKISGYDNEPVEAKVTFMSPEYRANSQITVVRASIINSTLKFKPGMQAQMIFTYAAHQALAVPTDAVIRDGKGAHVYVQTANNTFQPRMVKTGLEDFEQVEITEGLKENDVVAISGAYLLYSEIILKRGSDPMGGHDPD